MAAIEALEDIKELNARHADIKIEQMLSQQREQGKQYELMKKQMELDEDEAEIRYVRFIRLGFESMEDSALFSKAFGKFVSIGAPGPDEEDEDDDDDDDDDEEETVGEKMEQKEEIAPVVATSTKPKVSRSPSIVGHVCPAFSSRRSRSLRRSMQKNRQRRTPWYLASRRKRPPPPQLRLPNPPAVSPRCLHRTTMTIVHESRISLLLFSVNKNRWDALKNCARN